jgi:tRNA(Ile)-lysidine synthase TilS/MesJ
MIDLNIADTSIPVMDGNLGIALSGGADSSLLLYILMTNTKAKLEIFTYAKNTNFRVNALAATKVIEKCIQLTGNNNIEHHIRYENTFDRSLFLQRPIEYSDNNKITYMYTAITANPPSSIADSFLGKESNSEQENRDPTITHPVITGNWIRPFCNINKQKISAMYNILKIKESIFPLTFSCENVNTFDVYDHCNDCWWCKERKWGFNI